MELSPIMQKYLEYQRLKALTEESEQIKLLKKIDRQTSDKQSILQNVIGNFISDGTIFILRKLIRR